MRFENTLDHLIGSYRCAVGSANILTYAHWMNSTSRGWPRLSLRSLLLLVAAFAFTLGLLSYRIRRQRAAILVLRESGGQLDSPRLDAATWLTGMSIDSVQFLGPHVGDEAIDDIGTASAVLSVKRITFFETRVTTTGVRQLQSELPLAEIQLVTPTPAAVQPIEMRRR